MPIYVYQIINKDGTEGETFETIHKMSDPPLTKHPETGQPVRRVFLPPNLPSKYTERATKKRLSNDNLAKHGFTRYEKTGQGTYEKTAGDGPNQISRD